MSASAAAAARYVIAADDKTKGAIASALSGFRNMERGIKGTVSRINLALGLVGGVALKRALQNVFVETAKQSKDFAYALDDVKRSARSLLAAKDGAPAATAAMKELAQVLKDPEVVAAADAIASVFIRGAAGAVKFALGVKTLQEQIEELKKRRDAVATGGDDSKRTFIKGEPTFATDKAQEVYRINAELLQKQKQLREQDIALAAAEAAFWEKVNAAAEKASRRFGTMQEFQQNIKYLEEIEKKLKENLMKGPAGDADFFEQLKREGDVEHTKDFTQFFEDADRAASDVGDTLQQTSGWIDEYGDAIGRSINATAEWSAETDQAARNIQDALADFIFDPFEGGVRGMLKSFVDTLRRMAAEVAAQQIFKKLGGTEGIGNLLGSFLGFGNKPTSSSGFSGPRAKGGRTSAGSLYEVNENELEFFKPDVSGEVIPLSKMRSRSGGGSAPIVNITNHIDARGATSDLIKALPEVLRRNNDKVKADIIAGIRSGKYG